MLRWLNLLLVFVTLICYLTPLVNPQYVWPIAILGLFCPWLILANVVAAVMWLLLRKKYFWINLACIGLGFAYLGNLVNFGGEDIPPARETDLQLKVLSFNCRSFRPVGSSEYLDTKQISTYLKQIGPDIVCFQEYPFLQRVAVQFKEQIINSTGLSHFYQDPAGQLAIFSRYPLGKKGAKYYGNNANGYQFADMDTDLGKFRLYNIHLQSNAISNMADEVSDRVNLQEKDTWLTIKSMLSRYGRAAKIRAKQASEIAEHLSRSPYPVVLCGDFNDVPVSYVYRTLQKPLQDAFSLQGRGIGTTYAGSLPGLRIDYILSTPVFQVHSFQTLPTTYSDHRPVVAELSYAKGEL